MQAMLVILPLKQTKLRLSWLLFFFIVYTLGNHVLMFDSICTWKFEYCSNSYQMYDAMRVVTWALFACKKALNSITVKYKNGFVQAFDRDLKDNNTFYIYSDLANYSMVASGYNEINSRSSCEAWNDKDIHGHIMLHLFYSLYSLFIYNVFFVCMHAALFLYFIGIGAKWNTSAFFVSF